MRLGGSWEWALFYLLGLFLGVLIGYVSASAQYGRSLEYLREEWRKAFAAAHPEEERKYTLQ